ncbi:MAG: hypothetical protein JKX70_11155 [Phycisphaerales bacterium]|nr:hypothetical protein [Phycisphaerales bacterium]
MLMVLVVIVGVISFLNIKEGNRQWQQTQDLLNKVGTVEQQVAKLDRNIQMSEAATQDGLGTITSQLSELDARLSSGAFRVNDSGNGSGSGARSVGGNSRDSWARPGGVPIKWQDKFDFAVEPYDLDGFRLGGEFTEVFPAQLSKLTPVLAEDTYARRVNDQICETLADLNPETLELEGLLAEAWQYDPNGYWLRVKLRENIHFSDGVEITAEDVRWSFHDYINNPELETEAARSVMTSIENIEVISEKVVEFTFNQPDAYNLQSAMSFYILPKHFYAKFTPSQINQSTALAMGSGPFKLDNLDVDNQWAPGKDVILVRNEQYWGPKPALASMRFKVIIEPIARLTEFRNGNASMIPPSPPQFAKVSREEGWDEFAYSLNWANMRSGYGFIGWQCGPRDGKLTPFHDKRVRRR